jgi:hypothetical protein
MKQGEIAMPAEIHKMKLGSILRLANDKFTTITRVPDGWIYKFFEPCCICETCSAELLDQEKELPVTLVCAQFVPDERHKLV